MKKLILLTTLLAATSMTANADSILYGGITGGLSDYGNGNDKETLLGARLGTGILPFIDIEAGIIDFGELEDGPIKTETSTKYIAIKPTLTLPMFDIYLRAGVHQWDIDTTVLGTSTSLDGTDPMYGVGFDYFISDYFSLGASFTRYEVEEGEVEGLELNAIFYLDLL